MSSVFQRGFFRAMVVLGAAGDGASLLASEPKEPPISAWKIGVPIVSYWAGPALSEAVVRQMAEGGWNVVWRSEKDLDLVHRHGLRAQLSDGLLSPATLDSPAQREKLDTKSAEPRGLE